VSLQPISSNLEPAKAIRDAQIMWTETINTYGGITINNTRHLVQLILVDVGAETFEQMTKNVIEAHKAIDNGTYGDVHAMIAPYTTFLTEIHAIEAEKRKIVSCTPSSASRGIYECDDNQLAPCTKPSGRRFEYLVGMQPSTSTMFAPALSLLKIKGARSVGVFRETGVNELYYISSRNGVIEAAQNNKMSVVADLTVPFTDTLDANSTVIMKAIIAKMQQVNPDVIVGVVLETGCHAFVRAARLMKYTAGSFVIAVCASNPSLFKAVLGQDGRYVMGPVGWDRRLTGRTYNEDGSLNIHYFPHLNGTAPSPEQFAAAFQTRFGYSPSYHAANLFGCGLAFQYAAEAAQSFDAEAMKSTINEMNEITFVGQLQFNSFGQIVDLGLGGTVQFNRFNEDQLVLPIASSATDAVYPMPGWDERTEVISWYSTETELAIAIIAGTLFLGCIALMILFAVWRSQPQIIASSPLFIEFIILGGAMMYASLFFWTLETTDVMCNLQLWLLGVGFVLTFSALLVKTWRIWKIFHDKSLRIIKLDNIYLLKIMAVALAIEIIVLALWSALYTPHAATVVVDVNRPMENFRFCTSEQTQPFAIVLIVYKGLLICAAVVLGVWSRKVRSEYNESKYVLISVYNITFSAIILLVLFAINVSDRYLDFLIRSVAILWGVTATLCILLIPKIYYVVTGSHDPTKRRQNGAVQQDTTTPDESSHVPDTHEGTQEQLELLLERKRALNERLAELQASKNKSPNTSTSDPSPETTNVTSVLEDVAGHNHV
jgi:ABC-type branched-subunit amino acid transport system substrate-binding protein